MPRANWGIDASDVDDFDRDSQYMPYAGPIPPNGVYMWQIKVLKFAAADRKKLPQLRIGLALVPREERDEEQYEDYFIMTFPPVSDKTAFRYVPFLDAIGVTGKEFKERTILDGENNIRKIGRWQNSGEELICAELKDGQDQNGNSRKEIGVFMAVPEEDYEDEEEYDDDYDEEDPV